MTDFYGGLLGLFALFSVNRWLLPPLILNAPAYFLVQAGNVGVLAWVAVMGLPGLPHVGARWLVSGMIALHIVVNISQRDRAISRQD